MGNTQSESCKGSILMGISGEPLTEEEQAHADLFAGEEFNSELQDEYGFDANPPPGTELLGAMDEDFDQGPLDLEPDYGSGSRAERGQQEIVGDVMSDGTFLGSAAMYGPTEIGFTSEEDDLDTEGGEIGFDDEIGAGQAADRPGTELGAGQAADRPGTEIGLDSEGGEIDFDDEIGDEDGEDYEIGAGQAADRPGTELGAGSGFIAQDGPSEIGEGHYANDGASELGSDEIQMPFESFMLDDVHMGDDDLGFDGANDEIGRHEEDYELGQEYGEAYAIGAGQAADRPGTELGAGHYPTDGASEIGARAIAKVIETARDNRQPPPPMKAVDVDAPISGEDDWGLTDVVIGAAAMTGADPFPLLSQLLVRAGATTEPRIVRVDTEASYKAFRAENSPEFAALQAKLEDHINDPNAHGGLSDDDLSDDIADLVHLGAAVDEAEAEKRIELIMPKRFDGLVTAWREGGNVCASLTLPGQDGEVRICTSLEPIRKCVAEMSRHAAESGVSIGEVVNALPSMGCVLGAGTALKEMAAAAPAILSRPEAAHNAPFIVRIEPKTSPTLAALMMLCAAARNGVVQAQAEWQKLGSLSAGPIKQAMIEAVQLAKAAA